MRNEAALRGLAATFALIAAGGLFIAAKSTAPSAPQSHGIPPETVANYVHAVIEADRTIYSRHVVDRMQAKGIVTATENWEGQNTLPLPAQFLIDAARLVGKKENGIRYRLVSLWPIYERNAPATDFERQALEAVAKQPAKPHTGYVENGRRRYFQAVYSDVAQTQACVGCHNNHPNSPRRDWQLNDVMGGIVITLPLDQ